VQVLLIIYKLQATVARAALTVMQMIGLTVLLYDAVATSATLDLNLQTTHRNLANWSPVEEWNNSRLLLGASKASEVTCAHQKAQQTKAHSQGLATWPAEASWWPVYKAATRQRRNGRLSG